MMSKRWLLIFSLLLFVQKGVTQDKRVHEVKGGSLFEYELPDLDLLFENARNAPSMEYYKTLLHQERTALQMERIDWLEYFQLEAFYRYGIQAYQSNHAPGAAITFSNEPQGWYNLGASMILPLNDLFNRGKKVKKQKLQIQAVDNQFEASYDKLKLEILSIYAKAQKALSSFNLKQESFVLATAQYEESEAQFVNGRITTKELSAEKRNYSFLKQELKESEYELISLLLQLEIIANTKIINR